MNKNNINSRIETIADKFKIRTSPRFPNSVYSLDDIKNKIIKSETIPENSDFALSHTFEFDNIIYISTACFIVIIMNCKTGNGQICKNMLINDFIDKLINYNQNNILWLCHDNNLWTKTEDIIKLLGYKNIEDCNFIENENRITFNKILIDSSIEYHKINKLLPLETDFINESGIYQMIFESKNPKCKKFTKWINTEVLSSIIRTGNYDISTSNNEFAKQFKNNFIDYNDYIGQDVLYIVKINKKLYKYDITSNLVKELEGYKNTIECIKIFVLDTLPELKEIKYSKIVYKK